MNKIKVFCLPYAGGSKSIYSEWINKLSDVAQIIPIEYSGHSSRFGEELFEDAEKLADDIYINILKYNPVKYIVYGHSMGCLIAYLTTILLEKKYKYSPKGLIIGGTRPPHLKYKDEQFSGLSKDELIKKVFDLGQMDEEIMNEPELLDIFYEIFKADFCCIESYQINEIIKLKTPMFVSTGLKDDEAPLEDMNEWNKYTDGDFELKTFDESHFYPFTSNEFLDYFREKIAFLENL